MARVLFARRTRAVTGFARHPSGRESADLHIGGSDRRRDWPRLAPVRRRHAAGHLDVAQRVHQRISRLGRSLHPEHIQLPSASRWRRITHIPLVDTRNAMLVSLGDQAGTVRAGEELDITRLQPFLEENFSQSGPVSVEQFPSGHSNLTYLIRMGDERLGKRELVLRRPPFGSKVKSAHDMAREYRVLSKLHAAYSVAPKALLYCDDLSILGAPFYLMEQIRGMILRRDPPAGVPFPPETARRLSEAFIDNL